MRRVKLLMAVKLDNPYLVGDKGATLLLADYLADFAVRNKFGEYAGAPLEPGPARAELEAEEARIGTLKRLGEPQEIPVAKRGDGDLIPEERTVIDPAGLVTDPGAHEPPKRPYGNAPKSAWIRYAVSVDPGMTEERGELMTKADLMSRYGARLGEED
jgi:hypothetical protein